MLFDEATVQHNVLEFTEVFKWTKREICEHLRIDHQLLEKYARMFRGLKLNKILKMEWLTLRVLESMNWNRLTTSGTNLTLSLSRDSGTGKQKL